MRLAIIGYGKMGKEIERLALERGVQVTVKLDSRNSSIGDRADVFDVAVHFATSDSVVSHVEQCVKAKKNLVVGTTGWSKDLSQVQSLVKAGDIGLIHASNFSIGVNVFFRIMNLAGELFNNLEDYDVAVQEIHHKDKADSPSGTALTIADILMQKIKRKKEILNTPPSGKVKANQLQVTSTRAGSVVGTHTVVFDSPSDSLEFIHTAKNRLGFALGALLAAQWVQGRKGIFTMQDVLASNLK